MLKYLIPLFLLGILLPTRGHAQTDKKDEKATPTIAAKTEGMEAMPGYFPFYWSAKEGKVYLEIGRFDEDFLYVNSLAAGLGSNDIGLDRNQLGDSRVVSFKRVGPKVLLEQRNLDYRAISDNPDEAASVADAFARSVLEGFKVEAETDGRVLIDLTPMLMSDAHGVIQRLKANKQGTFKLDADRSAVYLDRTKNFPKNSEFEAALTFTGQAEGSQLRSVAPTPNSFTLRMHHSFVELPDDGYEARAFDPRCGYYPLRYADYATPIDQPLVKRLITRHRLEKKNPGAELSEPVEPIVYYLDRGAPEPIRSALLEGARWWNQAFEAAGYRDAFRVEMLPEGADPLDVRYNLINWVHRSTRGWSYGSSVTDPRTGEIIKGHVLLGSLRVRQDFLIAQGLIDAYAAGTTPDPRLEELALARLRQLSAHEVGHTLGLSHNFAASTNDRASVMDYPHPYVSLAEQGMNLGDAYDVGIGAWDKRTITYGYQDFPAGTDEAAALAEILAENERMGLRYVSDPDARPAGSSNPAGHLWDNGEDAIAELTRLMEIRKRAIANFGPENIPTGAPLSTLESVLVPVYLMHRYQVEAVAKSIGGYHYEYAVRTTAPPDKVAPVDPGTQRRATQRLLATTSTEALILPEYLRTLIPPPAYGYSRDRELFRTTNGNGLDPLGMAQAASDNTFKFLLHPHRVARLIEQRALFGEDYMSADEYFELMIDALDRERGAAERREPYRYQIAQNNYALFVHHLIGLASQSNSEAAKRAAYNKLIFLRNENTEGLPVSWNYPQLIIDRFLSDPDSYQAPKPVPLPDGSPIGCGE